MENVNITFVQKIKNFINNNKIILSNTMFLFLIDIECIDIKSGFSSFSLVAHSARALQCASIPPKVSLGK